MLSNIPAFDTISYSENEDRRWVFAAFGILLSFLVLKTVFESVLKDVRFIIT